MSCIVGFRNRPSSWFNVFTLSTLLISVASAQITIPQSGFSNLLTAGKSFHYYETDSAPKPINIGKRGGPNIYDFNGYNFQVAGLSNVYSIGTIPTLAARYPANALVFGPTQETVENNPVFLFGTDTLFVIGQASLIPGPRFLHIRPYEPMAIFPVTYQTARTYSHTHYDTTYSASGVVVGTDVYSGSDSVNVDGFGTLKILGLQFECLRVKLNHYTFADKEFMYMTREGLFLDIEMASTQRDTGLIQPTGFILLVPTSIVSADKQVSMPTEYVLGQNYPNPFNPGTAIRFQLPAVSRVNLQVFDLLGREVAALVQGERAAGTHVVHWDGTGERGEQMPSGVYYYRLRVGSAEVTKRMILLK